VRGGKAAARHPNRIAIMRTIRSPSIFLANNGSFQKVCTGFIFPFKPFFFGDKLMGTTRCALLLRAI